MNTKFDELTKSLAQSVTRRAALKKFGMGLAGMALATLGLANTAKAGGHVGPPDNGTIHGYCQTDPVTGNLTGYCVVCDSNGAGLSHDCVAGAPATQVGSCYGFLFSGTKCSIKG